ncbi:MAG: class I SAM-dependent methyltransferase [Candidatus Dormibacteraeota bacterium]|uniref:Class I SAM-dependent methyltransferase n=1 Tax=Candidatus Aeolococcus gillhamiae TaxID=3127015 RepID=A0A934JYV1_9BACT|nr:class I SAM-dependent methyltransferase [Candidatus Dormibacteraeota bacterium]
MNSDAHVPTWSDIAGWYDELVQAGSGTHETALACLVGLLPDLHGSAVLDVACGQGLATRALLDSGADQVIGTDSSATMVELARKHGASAGKPISYVVDDAQNLDAFEDASFDGATCQLALMDIPDLPATLRAVRRVLKPAGWFVFVIGHPCFLAPNSVTLTGADGAAGVFSNGYFEERFWRSSNPNGVRRAGTYHRPLSAYLNAVLVAGFRLEAVDEPRPSALLRDQRPVYKEVPAFFAVRARREPSTSARATAPRRT